MTASEPLLSLRTFLSDLDAMGELVTVDGADWNLEIGALAEISYRMAQPPAIVFDHIKDYPAGMRVALGTTGSPRRLAQTLRVADALGNGDIDNVSLVEALRGKPLEWQQRAADFPVEVVASAPFMENVLDGDAANLLNLPVPQWHQHDGGRFIGTGCLVVTSDPETGAANGGCYRMQVQDEGRAVTIAAVPGKHGAQNIERWFEREGRAPVAVSFGHDPLLLVLGGTEVPLGISELDYAGAVLGHRVPVVSGPETGLPIPAASEVVVEGWLTPDDTRTEGPFGEWTGYYAGSPKPSLNLVVDRLYYRNDPILLGAPPGKPPHDYSYMRTVMKSAMVLDQLVGMGVPGVGQVWLHEAGGGRLFLVVSIDQRYAGHANQVGLLAAECPAAAYMNRYVVVVDSDIDVTNLSEVVWALSTRTDPAEDIQVLRRNWGSRLDPMLEAGAPAYNSRAVINACIPYERRSTFPRVAQSDPQFLATIAQKWGHVLGADAKSAADNG